MHQPAAEANAARASVHCPTEGLHRPLSAYSGKFTGVRTWYGTKRQGVKSCFFVPQCRTASSGRQKKQGRVSCDAWNIQGLPMSRLPSPFSSSHTPPVLEPPPPTLPTLRILVPAARTQINLGTLTQATRTAGRAFEGSVYSISISPPAYF